MTFIINYNDSRGRRIYSNRYDENIEHEVDAAWEDVYSKFPDAYIESF